jgi:TonB-dependent receptor
MDLGPAAVIKSNTLVLRKTTDRVEKREIRTQDNQIEGHLIEWEERELLSQILSGTHQVGTASEHQLEWSGAISQANMHRPDTRYYQLLIDGDERRFDNRGRSNERVFSEVQDDVREGQLSYQLPINKKGDFQLTARVGLGVMEKKRESQTRRFKYEVDTASAVQITGDSSIVGKSPDAICTDEVIRAGACELVDTTVPSDSFKADQNIQSYFFDSETLLYERLRLNAGVRFENSVQNITTYEGVARNPVDGNLVMKDYLPAFGMTYFLTEKMQLRFGYSETISRPAFKDLNPVGYYDDEKNRNVSGNPQLRGTIIENIDARWEWYFGNQENVSLGVFYKNFQNPIEEVAGSFQNGVLTYSEGGFQLANVGNATAQGFELEFRKSFGFISSMFQPLALGGNYSWIDSSMTIFPELASQVTNQNRPLQGQSPYVINLNLDYDNRDTGTTATLLYNIFGSRIDTVGTDRRPDTYQESYNSVDFVFSQKFGKNEKNQFGMKLQNILNPEILLTMGENIKESYRRGRKLSLSFTRTF